MASSQKRELGEYALSSTMFQEAHVLTYIPSMGVGRESGGGCHHATHNVCPCLHEFMHLSVHMLYGTM